MMVQETKLQANKLELPGYHVVRKDWTRGRREGIQGGGVATLVREGIPFRCLDLTCVAPNDDTTYITAVQLCVGARLTLINAYVPPIRGGGKADNWVQRFNPDYWPTDSRTFIFTDLNGHGGSWDPLVTEDELGRAVDDWCSTHSFVAASTGEATRQNRAPPYTRSTPDVTLHHARWTGRVNWKPAVEMSSDHLPIIVDIRTSGRPARRRAATRASYRKADWGTYEEKLDEGLNNLPVWTNTTTIKEANEQFSRVVKMVAAAAIPQGGRVSPQPW